MKNECFHCQRGGAVVYGRVLFMYNFFSNGMRVCNVKGSTKDSVHDINQKQDLAEVIDQRDGIEKVGVATAGVDPQMPKDGSQCC
jgi:hypothetical protein